MATVHLHRDDVPDTLALLGALLGDRSTEVPGYSLDETGADVDWDLLLEGLALRDGEGRSAHRPWLRHPGTPRRRIACRTSLASSRNRRINHRMNSADRS